SRIARGALRRHRVRNDHVPGLTPAMAVRVTTLCLLRAFSVSLRALCGAGVLWGSLSDTAGVRPQTWLRRTVVFCRLQERFAKRSSELVPFRDPLAGLGPKPLGVRAG